MEWLFFGYFPRCCDLDFDFFRSFRWPYNPSMFAESLHLSQFKTAFEKPLHQNEKTSAPPCPPSPTLALALALMSTRSESRKIQPESWASHSPVAPPTPRHQMPTETPASSSPKSHLAVRRNDADFGKVISWYGPMTWTWSTRRRMMRWGRSRSTIRSNWSCCGERRRPSREHLWVGHVSDGKMKF